jgi:SAM-dependent methyltransferase
LLPHDTHNIGTIAESLGDLRKTDPDRFWRTRAIRTPDDSRAVLWENIDFNRCLREKEFAIIRKLVEKHRIPGALDVLDVGCGTGDVSRFLVDLGFKRIDAIDFPEMIGIARRRNPHHHIRYIASSAESYRVSKKYGLVVSMGGFSAMMDRKMFAVIDNCIAMLRHGGYILMIDPFHKYILVRVKVSAEEVAEYMKRRGLSLVEESGMVFWPFRMFLHREKTGLTAYQTKVAFDTGEGIMTRLGHRLWSDYKVLLFKG